MSSRNRFAFFAGLLTTALLTTGCQDFVAPERPGDNVLTLAAGAEPSGITGLGALGSGLAIAFMDRQEFDFAVTGGPSGRLLLRDYSVVRTNGSVATMTVDASKDAATGISSFTQTSARCVTFGGIGRVDTGDLFEFSAVACDNGSPGARVDSLRFSVPAISYHLAERLSEGEITLSGATKGDLDVTVATTGSDIDPGYTVTVGGTQSRSVGSNATVRFAALVAGSYSVELTGVAANCTLSGSNPRTVSVVAGQVASTRFDVSCVPATPNGTRVTGRGVLGNGLPLPKMDRVEFDFEATSAPGGRIVVTDYSILRGDGEVAQMTADHATDPATGVTSFSRTSATCVRFGGIARLNDGGSLYDFFVDACDNASPGAGADTFSLTLPKRPYSKGGTLTQGDIAITTF